MVRKRDVDKNDKDILIEIKYELQKANVKLDTLGGRMWILILALIAALVGIEIL